MSPARTVFAAVALAFVACTDVPVAPDIDLQPQFARAGEGRPSGDVGATVTCTGTPVDPIPYIGIAIIRFESGTSTVLTCTPGGGGARLDEEAIEGTSGPWDVRVEFLEPGDFRASCEFSGDALPTGPLICAFANTADGQPECPPGPNPNAGIVSEGLCGSRVLVSLRQR